MWNKLFFLLLSVAVFAGDGEQSFTPSSYQFPIQSIVLSTGMSAGFPSGDQVTLYECTSGDCLMELKDNISLSNLTISKEIKVANYRYLTITSCSGNNAGFNAKVKGTVTITKDNTTKKYYSHATEGLLEQKGSISEEEVSVTFNQCRFYHELQDDFEVSDSIALPLTLFMDLKNVAWARLGIKTNVPVGGCFQGVEGTDGQILSLCVGLPHLTPIASSKNPTIQRYFIRKNTEAENDAGGMVVLFTNANGTVLGGFTRRYFTVHSKAPSAEFDMPIKRVVFNSNGSYSMKTFGRTFDSTYLDFSEFLLDTHQNKSYKDDGNVSHSYIAVKE
jgi:hypothetical protein